MDNQFELNGRRYGFGTIPPVEAIRIEVAIARVIGEPLFKAFVESKTGADGKPDKDAEVAAGAAAIGLLASKMDADELIQTMQTVFKYVGTEGKTQIDINVEFNGRNKDLWLVFIAALRFNFADFFPAGLLSSIGARTAKLS